MKRAYSVKIGNGRNWVSEGAVSREFWVLAEDAMSAMMVADEHASALMENLPQSKVEAIRVLSVSESAEYVAESIATNTGHDDEKMWVEQQSKRIRESIG